MNPLALSTLILILIVSQAQPTVTGSSDLVVLKFSCGTYRESSGVVRSIHDPGPPMNEPISLVQPPPRNERQEMRDRREMNQRATDLRGAEIVAASSARKGTKLYFYHLEIRNTGTRKIKSFAWEYQSTGVSDISDRQFFCAVNAKPNDKKEFDLLTYLAPSRVVDVSSTGQKTDKNGKGVVVINKIDYADGSTWVRPGWNRANFSSEAMQSVESGKCVGL